MCLWLKMNLDLCQKMASLDLRTVLKHIIRNILIQGSKTIQNMKCVLKEKFSMYIFKRQLQNNKAFLVASEYLKNPIV